ncbi:MAG: hypothetical protein H6815_02000 [Phycisphaeraceae bacterium]|nr:hypothetical protein [Phycisphaerales bacterium]MCB9859202.1 hypothetical protein [Phycisphaeraceae bacterium]
MSDFTIHESTNCYACGYDLRRLKESGRCPECGLHIRFTLESRYSERVLQRENAQAEEDRIRWEQQMADWNTQNEINQKIQQQSLEEAERYSRILDRWEHLQDRFEGVIARMEQQLTTERDGSDV